MKPLVLVVEDISVLAETYAAALRRADWEVEIAPSGAAALHCAERRAPQALVLDVNLPDMSGLDLLRRLRGLGHACEAVVVTAEGSVNRAVEAMRQGALDFLVKPFSGDRLRAVVGGALRKFGAEERGAQTPDQENGERFVGFIGRSPPMEAVYRILRSAAPTNATVFVTGESGAGKELCADALHRLSKRASGPLVVLNCAAIPRDLLESEIFGHVKGAFTGATADRKGAALQADGGTLFLDEVCEMDLALQAKMLRFLQDKQVRRLGEDQPRTTDVRLVCATNRDPMAEMAAGRFREDLFYRLHVVPVELPPLRERDADVLLIARAFLEKFAREDARAFRGFSPEAEMALLAYQWPGNVRQLQNVVRSVVVLNDGPLVTPDMLPREIALHAGVAARCPLVACAPTSDAQDQTAAQALAGLAACEDPAPVDSARAPAIATPAALAPQPARFDDAPLRPLETVIRQTIEEAIARCGGSIPKAAAALDVSPSTLYRRLQAWEERQECERGEPQPEDAPV
ncbi:MAG: sigma-54-dependent transcriptional regulator [Beijerinckiaceae bacterium]